MSELEMKCWNHRHERAAGPASGCYGMHVVAMESMLIQ